jgi:hypothetical protein
MQDSIVSDEDREVVAMVARVEPEAVTVERDG